MAVPATQVWQTILDRLRERHGPQIQQFQQNHPNWQPGQFLREHRQGNQFPPAWANLLNNQTPPQNNQWAAFGQPGSATVSAAQPVPGTTPPPPVQGPPATSPWAGMHWGTRAPSNPVM